MYTRATGSSMEQAGVRPDRAALSLFHLSCVLQSPHRPELSCPAAPSPLLTAFPLHFQGLDGAKGEKGASGERGPHGLPVSVVVIFVLEVLHAMPSMPADLLLFHPGTSWPTRPYWVARNQRREGNLLTLSPLYTVTTHPSCHSAFGGSPSAESLNPVGPITMAL